MKKFIAQPKNIVHEVQSKKKKDKMRYNSKRQTFNPSFICIVEVSFIYTYLNDTKQLRI